MMYKLGYNLPKTEINKRVFAYEANQATIESQATQIEQCRNICRDILESFRKEIYAMTLPDNRIRMVIDRRINEALQAIEKIG